MDLKPSADALESPGPLLPAVALRRLEPPADVLQATPDAPPYYLCLSADNRCHTAAHPPASAGMTAMHSVTKDCSQRMHRLLNVCLAILTGQLLPVKVHAGDSKTHR